MLYSLCDLELLTFLLGFQAFDLYSTSQYSLCRQILVCDVLNRSTAWAPRGSDFQWGMKHILLSRLHFLPFAQWGVKMSVSKGSSNSQYLMKILPHPTPAPLLGSGGICSFLKLSSLFPWLSYQLKQKVIPTNMELPPFYSVFCAYFLINFWNVLVIKCYIEEYEKKKEKNAI